MCACADCKCAGLNENLFSRQIDDRSIDIQFGISREQPVFNVGCLKKDKVERETVKFEWGKCEVKFASVNDKHF